MSDENEAVQRPTVDPSAIGITSEVEVPKSYPFQEFAETRVDESLAFGDQSDGLQIAFAESQLALTAVEKWRPGELVPFDEPFSSVVRISIGGRDIAQGELLEIDGRVVVRVTEVQHTVVENKAA